MNKPHSYSYRNCVPATEVMEHVRQAYRDTGDPLFAEISKQAAVNGIHGAYCGHQGVTFTYPTKHPRGYLSVLKYVASHPQCRRSDIWQFFKAKVNNTIHRLDHGRLIEADAKHKWSVTELGKLYLMVCAQYAVERKTCELWH